MIRLRSLLVVVLLLVAACGGDGDEPADTAGSGSITSPTSAPGDAADTTTTSPEETMPEADPSSYVGQNRVVHLAVTDDGSTPTLDIWAKRSFEYAPILLVEGLEYGEVSDWYGRPEGMAVAAFESGSGPDGDAFAELFSADDTQQYTHLVMWDRDSGTASGYLLEDVAPGNPQEFPEAEPGQALVQLYAYQLRLNPLSEGESFEQTIAGVPTSFNLGIEGIEGCAPQPRMTDQGLSPVVLGGTQRAIFDLDPGTTTFTFHGWGSDDEGCADTSLIEPLDVTLEADERAWGLLHSPDGESIELLQVPLQ